MDIATKGLVEEFIRENSLQKIKDVSTQFEHFSSYALISENFQDAIDTTEIVVGSDGEYGVDGIAIVINDLLVDSSSEIDDIAKVSNSMSASIYIIQSETSIGFDLQKFGHFGSCVLDIFLGRYVAPSGSAISEKMKLIQHLYAHTSKFRHGNPQCYLFYATTGTYKEDAKWGARRESITQSLWDTNLFSRVKVDCVGAQRLQKSYIRSKNAVSRDILFDKRTALPEMPGVTEAYIGVVLAEEFLKLIEDDQNEIMRGVFYDNIRDWQDYNEVNSEMKATLDDENKRELFGLLNNGVTIIARQVRPTGNRFTIEDYQIVNGCQTSNVMHRSREKVIGKNVYIPVRLVSTVSDEVTIGITRATNRQTSVSQEELLAVSDFQKKLEMFFASYSQPDNSAQSKLYYERRSRQYNAELGIEKVRVVSVTTLIRVFSAMFLGTPHRTTRSYKNLLGNIGKEIFGADHKLEPYYACAFSAYRLEYFFRNQTIDVKYKPARYQILLAVRLFVLGPHLSSMNSKDAAKEAAHLAQCAWNINVFEKIVRRACDLIELLSNGQMDRDFLHTEDFTKLLFLSFHE